MVINGVVVEVQAALCHPGPDLVVCDEGHVIRNDTTQISKALKNITTKSVLSVANVLLLKCYFYWHPGDVW